MLEVRIRIHPHDIPPRREVLLLEERYEVRCDWEGEYASLDGAALERLYRAAQEAVIREMARMTVENPEAPEDAKERARAYLDRRKEAER